MSSFAPPSKKARRSHSNGAAVDSDGEFFPGLRADGVIFQLTSIITGCGFLTLAQLFSSSLVMQV